MNETDDSVWENLCNASTAFRRAEAELTPLNKATYVLHQNTPWNVSSRQFEVSRLYTTFLAHASVVTVCVNQAVKAARGPIEVSAWWASLRDNEVHAFFKRERDRALKQVSEETLASRMIVADGNLGYWAFAEGPYAGDPVVPRCMQYMDWLYDNVITEASGASRRSRIGSPLLSMPSDRPPPAGRWGSEHALTASRRPSAAASCRVPAARGGWSRIRRSCRTGSKSSPITVQLSLSSPSRTRRTRNRRSGAVSSVTAATDPTHNDTTGRNTTGRNHTAR
jgi:hypothetical protein